MNLNEISFISLLENYQLQHLSPVTLYFFLNAMNILKTNCILRIMKKQF